MSGTPDVPEETAEGGAVFAVTEPSVLERRSTGAALVIAPSLPGFNPHIMDSQLPDVHREAGTEPPGVQGWPQPGPPSLPLPKGLAWTQEEELGEAGLLSARLCARPVTTPGSTWAAHSHPRPQGILLTLQRRSKGPRLTVPGSFVMRGGSSSVPIAS